MVIYLKLFLTAIFWGGTFVAARIVARHVGPYSASFLRFFTAALLLVVILLVKERGMPRLQRRHVVPVVLLGMTGVFAYNVFFFLGMKTISAGRASLIVATNPIFIVLLSAIFFRERLDRRKLAGTLLCLGGAIIVISRGDPLSIFMGGVGRGEIYILGCVASWVAYTLIGKSVLQEIPPLTAVTYSCLIGGAVLFLPAYREDLPGLIGGFYPADWIGIIYLGFFGTVLGFFWYYEGIKAIGSSRASVFINVVPVSGVFFGWLILDEIVNLSLLVGAVLVLAGVMLTNHPGDQAKTHIECPKGNATP